MVQLQSEEVNRNREFLGLGCHEFTHIIDQSESADDRVIVARRINGVMLTF